MQSGCRSYEKKIYTVSKIPYHKERIKNSALSTRTFMHCAMNTWMRRGTSLFVLAAAGAAIFAGIAMDEHAMIFSHAIVVCLSCIGLG